MVKTKVQQFNLFTIVTLSFGIVKTKRIHVKRFDRDEKKGMERQFVPRNIMGQGKWMCSCYLAHEICLSADRILILKQKAAELKPLLDQGKSPH